MPDYTDEEYDAMDEYWTTHMPKLSGNGSGFFAKKAEKLGRSYVIFVDDMTRTWLQVKAEAEHKSPDEIIGNLVRKEIVAEATAANASS